MYPNFDNLPWVATSPFRLVGDLAVSQDAGGFTFSGVESRFKGGVLTKGSLYLVESMSFVPSIPDNVLLDACDIVPTFTISRMSDNLSPVFRDNLPFAGRCDYLPLRWWFKVDSDPDFLTLSCSSHLDITPDLVGVKELHFRLALNGYEVQDQTWIKAFLHSEEWTPASSESTRGVSMVQGYPSNALAGRSF